MADEKMSSIKSPLAQARGLGSAKSGTHHWILQRLTAIGLLPLTVWFFTCPYCFASGDYSGVIVWLGHHTVAIPMVLFLIGGYIHAALGVQTVIEDYVHHTGWKFFGLVFTKLFFFAMAVVSLYAVFYINYGLYG